MKTKDLLMNRNTNEDVCYTDDFGEKKTPLISVINKYSNQKFTNRWFKSAKRYKIVKSFEPVSYIYTFIFISILFQFHL